MSLLGVDQLARPLEILGTNEHLVLSSPTETVGCACAEVCDLAERFDALGLEQALDHFRDDLIWNRRQAHELCAHELLLPDDRPRVLEIRRLDQDLPRAAHPAGAEGTRALVRQPLHRLDVLELEKRLDLVGLDLVQDDRQPDQLVAHATSTRLRPTTRALPSGP